MNASGEVYAILDMGIDVTKQVVAQLMLQQAEDSLRSAIEVAEMGTLELNVKNGLVAYSDR